MSFFFSESRDRHHDEHRWKSARTECEACNNLALDNKKRCQDCLNSAAGSSSSDQISHLMNWMQTSFVDSMESVISKGTESAMKAAALGAANKTVITTVLHSDSKESGEIRSDMDSDEDIGVNLSKIRISYL